MTYLVMQMLLCLILAFLFGVLVGWWLGRRRSEDSASLVDSVDSEALDSCQEQLAKCRTDLAEDRGRLEACRGELKECRGELEDSHSELENYRKRLDDCLGQLEECQAREDEPDESAAGTPMPLADLSGSDDESTDEGEAETAEANGAADAVIDDDAVGESDAGLAGGLAAMGVAVAADAGADDAEPDDLKVVEGIGPKIEGLLNAGDIHTWARLAETEVSVLQSILDEAGPRYRIHDPGTWPQQAALAAAGSWDELEALQDRLKGGRET